MPELIQVLPRTPPRIDGVGDYAWRVGEQLRSQHGISSRYLVCDPTQPDGDHDGFARSVLPEQSVDAFVSGLESLSQSGAPAILLHYVGYGFERNGAPDWLLRGLERFLATHTDAALATVFHELYATSMPWRRAFWFSASQRRIAKAIRNLSARALCTIEKNEGQLLEWAPEKPIDCMPVPSAIGEPGCGALPAWETRHPALVVFGLAHSRQRAYSDAAAIDTLCNRFSVEEVIDIGPPLEVAPHFANARWIRKGPLDPAEVVRTLLQSRYGYLYYPVDYLAKSSIFGAYCAHGVATVLPAAGDGAPDGLAADVHYASAKRLPSEDALAGIARAATAWYQPHAIAAHAEWAARRA